MSRYGRKQEALVEGTPTRGLSVAEFAAAVGIGRSLAYELIADKKVASIKIGRRRLVPDSEVGKLLMRGAA